MKNCPNCKEEVEDSANFCGACGEPITGQAVEQQKATPAAPGTCGNCRADATEIDEDGFCKRCGHDRTHEGRNHFEVIIDQGVAAVSDRGIRHHQNEDFFAIGKANTKEAALALVVCDGVSQSQNPQDGSALAANTARDYLIKALETGYESPATTITAALVKAQEAICTVPFNPAAKNEKGAFIDPAQCTIVAALAHNKKVTIGWLGDSRAYWLTNTACVQISQDHSWFNEVVEAGEMTAEEAAKDSRAHSITRSLGAAANGSNPGVEPSFRTLNLTEKGLLLVVSDGFWNYADTEAAVLELVKAQPAGIDALNLARRLVNFAIDKGGKDNITVVAARF